MSAPDEILDRIDDVLAGHDQAVNDDWAVGPDAMRSRPAEPADQPWGEPTLRRPDSIDMAASSIVARAARMVAERDRAFARLAAVTDAGYASEMWRSTSGDVRQLDVIARIHTTEGDDERVRARVRGTLATADLPEPHPNLRLKVINALGLMPVLTRVCEWLAGALERIQPVLDQLDPRPSARRRRRAGRTITVTLSADVSAFSDAMRRVGATAAEAGASMAAMMTRLFGTGYQDPDETTAEDIRRQRRDRNEIRAIASTELAAAREHLDRHVDGIYADLGLPRDPHLTRGEN